MLGIKGFLLFEAEGRVEGLGGFATFVHCLGYVCHPLAVRSAHFVDAFWCSQLGVFDALFGRGPLAHARQGLHGGAEDGPRGVLGWRDLELGLERRHAFGNSSLHFGRVAMAHQVMSIVRTGVIRRVGGTRRRLDGRDLRHGCAGGGQHAGKEQAVRGFKCEFHGSFLSGNGR